MKTHWWSCVLGLLCMPAEVILSTWTVSQDPFSISLMRVNSSAEITCSTSLSDMMGLYLRGYFRGNREIVHLNLVNGLVTKNTTAPEFQGRIRFAPAQQGGEGCGFSLQLSLLGLEDTDLYYCSWSYFNPHRLARETMSANGTMIIVRDRDPQEQCKDQILDLVLIALSVTAFTATLFLFIAALIVRCKRFKKQFRPARAVTPPRPPRPRHVCPQQTVQHSPYLITSADPLDFRGIL